MLQVSRAEVDFSFFFFFPPLFLSPSYNQGIKTSGNKKNCWSEFLSKPALAKAFSVILELVFAVEVQLLENNT